MSSLTMGTQSLIQVECRDKEDQLKRILMFFNVDISKRVCDDSRYHFEGKNRNPGGGVNKLVKESSMSIAEPNGFYANCRHNAIHNNDQHCQEQKRLKYDYSNSRRHVHQPPPICSQNRFETPPDYLYDANLPYRRPSGPEPKEPELALEPTYPNANLDWHYRPTEVTRFETGDPSYAADYEYYQKMARRHGQRAIPITDYYAYGGRLSAISPTPMYRYGAYRTIPPYARCPPREVEYRQASGSIASGYSPPAYRHNRYYAPEMPQTSVAHAPDYNYDPYYRDGGRRTLPLPYPKEYEYYEKRRQPNISAVPSTNDYKLHEDRESHTRPTAYKFRENNFKSPTLENEAPSMPQESYDYRRKRSESYSLDYEGSNIPRKFYDVRAKRSTEYKGCKSEDYKIKRSRSPSLEYEWSSTPRKSNVCKTKSRRSDYKYPSTTRMSNDNKMNRSRSPNLEYAGPQTTHNTDIKGSLERKGSYNNDVKRSTLPTSEQYNNIDRKSTKTRKSEDYTTPPKLYPKGYDLYDKTTKAPKKEFCYDKDCAESKPSSKKYTSSVPTSIERKQTSFDFMDYLEIPHKVLKPPKTTLYHKSHIARESRPCVRFSGVEIPYNSTNPKARISDRSDSGCDYQHDNIKRPPQESKVSFRQPSRKTLKQRISGFFKKSKHCLRKSNIFKSKSSRLMNYYKPTRQLLDAHTQCSDWQSNTESAVKIPKTGSKPRRSASSLLVRNKRKTILPCAQLTRNRYNTAKRSRVVYPTVYRRGLSQHNREQIPTDEENYGEYAMFNASSISPAYRSKVKNIENDTSDFGKIQNEYGTLQEDEIDMCRRVPSGSCNSYKIETDHTERSKDQINVCLTIRTTDVNLAQPPKIIPTTSKIKTAAFQLSEDNDSIGRCSLRSKVSECCENCYGNVRAASGSSTSRLRYNPSCFRRADQRRKCTKAVFGSPNPSRSSLSRRDYIELGTRPSKRVSLVTERDINKCCCQQSQRSIRDNGDNINRCCLTEKRPRTVASRVHFGNTVSSLPSNRNPCMVGSNESLASRKGTYMDVRRSLHSLQSERYDRHPSKSICSNCNGSQRKSRHPPSICSNNSQKTMCCCGRCASRISTRQPSICSNSSLKNTACSHCSKRASSASCKKSQQNLQISCCKPRTDDSSNQNIDLCCPKLISESNEEASRRHSIIEEVKRELLETLRSEQQLENQLNYLRPTPHIMFLPCVPEGLCQSNAKRCIPCNPCPAAVCWTTPSTLRGPSMM